MSYTATNDVFDAIVGQIKQELAHEVDNVLIFDGTLNDALTQHFNSSGLNKSVIFIGSPQEDPLRLDGCGLPLQSNVYADVYVVVRAQGKTRYTVDRERLWDLSDQLIHSTFTCTNRATDFSAVITNIEFARRIRMETEGSLLAHKIEFIVRPKR